MNAEFKRVLLSIPSLQENSRNVIKLNLLQ